MLGSPVYSDPVLECQVDIHLIGRAMAFALLGPVVCGVMGFHQIRSKWTIVLQLWEVLGMKDINGP